MSLAGSDTPLSIEKVGAGDTATAETSFPLTPAGLFDFLSDIERLIRLNPQLAILRWLPTEWGFRFAGHNESNDRAFDLAAVVDIAPDERSITLRYDAGLKQTTQLRVAAAAGGARLIVTDHYPHIDDPADPRVADVDKSLVPWVAALRRHLLARQRWSGLTLIFPLWRWWTERFMLALPPRQRRIVRLLVWTSVLEFLVFLGVLVLLRFSA
jgi:hypothetical protein